VIATIARIDHDVPRENRWCKRSTDPAASLFSRAPFLRLFGTEGTGWKTLGKRRAPAMTWVSTMQPRHLGLFLAAALVLGPPLRARENWIYARTANFELLSTASEKESRSLLVELEQFRANFLATFPMGRTYEPRATVVLFGDDRTFTPYKPIYKGKPKNVAGYFVGQPDEVTIALTTETPDADLADPKEAIFHEYVHLLLYLHDIRLPLWLDEGLADFYSTLQVEGDSIVFGRPKTLYVKILNDSALMPLKELFAVTRKSANYNEERRAGIFYAQSWMLTHYLICGTDRTNTEKLIRFLSLQKTSPNNTDANFHAAFDQAPAELEMALRTYLESGWYHTRKAKVQIADLAAKISFRPATDFERDFALLNLRWRVRRSGSAAQSALQLAEQQPNSPRPFELLAAIEMTKGDSAKAIQYWERAAGLKSDNAFVYEQLGWNAVQPLTREFSLDYRLPPQRSADLRFWLDHALELSPDWPEAQEALALVEAFAPGVRAPVVLRLQSAVGQMRDSSRTLLALAIIRWRLGDQPTSAKIVENLLASPQATPEVKAAALTLRERLAATDAGPP
jgi:tetratricopeptide (TPR) repeat protein